MGGKMRVVTLAVCTGLLSALLGGCLVDVDHLLFYLGWLPEGRYFHPYIILVGTIFTGCGIISILALFCRFYMEGRILK